jgi:hypothetical protein
MPEKETTTRENETLRIIPADESVFLEGPKNRGYEFLFSIKVWWQFLKAFRTLHFVGPCITVFGSARFKETISIMQKAREFGKRIAEMGFYNDDWRRAWALWRQPIAVLMKMGVFRWDAILNYLLNKRPNKYFTPTITIDYFFLT